MFVSVLVQYAVSLSLLLLTQIVVWLVLFSNLRLFQQYSLEAAIGTAAGIIVEVLSDPIYFF